MVEFADKHDMIFGAACDTVCEWAAQLTDNYQSHADPGVVAKWPVGQALVMNGVIWMATVCGDLNADEIVHLGSEVQAFICDRLVQHAEKAA